MTEKHGDGAYVVARDMERQANNLSSALFWRSVKTVIESRAKLGLEILPSASKSNCISCLVNRFSGNYDREGLSPPLACLSCVAQRLGSAPQRRTSEGLETRRAVWPANTVELKDKRFL